MWLDQKGSKRFTCKEVHRFGHEPATVPDEYAICRIYSFETVEWDSPPGAPCPNGKIIELHLMRHTNPIW